MKTSYSARSFASIAGKTGLAAVGLLLIGQGCLFGDSVDPSDGALWKSNNAGDSYVQLATLPESTGATSIKGVNVTSLEIDPSDPSAYYMGTTRNGLFTSLDAGSTWQRPEFSKLRGNYITETEVDPNNKCTVYIALPNEILKTEDCLRTFETIYTEVREEVFISTFEMDWFSSEVLWMGTTEGDVIRSSDAGRSWSTSLKIKDEISSILVSNADSRTILVGTDDYGYYRSVDSGTSWVEHEDDLRRQWRGSDEVYGFAQTRKGDVLIMNTEYGLLRSYDAGVTWEEVSIIAPGDEARIWSVAVGLNEDDRDVLYYATTGALYVSDNAGASWEVKDLPSSRAPRVLRVHPSAGSNLLVGFRVAE